MAVYTDVGDDELREFVADYEIGELVSYAGIAEGVENSNFLIRTSTGSYILTLYEQRVAPADLPFFIGLMEHLAKRGVTCPQPLRTKHGEALHQLCRRPAAMVTVLEGVWPRRVQPFHCAELGLALGKLHLAGADFPLKRNNALSVDAWPELAQSCLGGADSVREGLADLLLEECRYLEAHWPSDLPVGVIHADLFPDNVFFLGEHLSGLIDFYFACTDAFAYDLAVCLNAWCFEPDGSFNHTKGHLLIQRYQSVRPLSAAEANCLPLLARGAALRFLLTRLYDWLNQRPGALVKPKDPLEYLAKLRCHQSVRDPASYGFVAVDRP
jgi:homoserine kinase type II